jgi:predicted Abi (CAAX) family protease
MNRIAEVGPRHRRPRIVARLLDVRDALTTVPSAVAWGRCLAAYGGFLAVAIPIGWSGAIVHPSMAPLPASSAIVVAGTLLLHPALTEELLFRALLLPRRVTEISRTRLATTVAIALFLYVIAHPVNAWLFWPAAFPVFSSASYLTMAALLGLTCSAAYLMSGSIWPAVLIHWATVAAWILLLGGQRLLQPQG